MPKPSPMGSTFAERAAAAAGESSFTAPPAEVGPAGEQSTFAERTKAAKKTSTKAVEADDEKAENKAVKSASKKS